MLAPRDTVLWVALIIAALFAIVAIFVVLQFISVYLQALLCNARVTMLEMLSMRLRKADIRVIVLSRICAIKAGLEIPTAALERHYLEGGNVPRVVAAMIAARAARVSLPWETARVIDLEGRDVLEEVQASKRSGRSVGA